MEMMCADCGCAVRRGVIVRACEQNPDCCCEDLAVAGDHGTARDA